LEPKTGKYRHESKVKIVLILSLLVIFSYFLSMLYGLTVIFFTAEGRAFSTKNVGLYIPLPILNELPLPIRVNIGLLFLLLWCTYIACFAIALLVQEDFASIIYKLHRVRDIFKNNLLAMPLLASTLLIVIAFVQKLQEDLGIPTIKPSGPIYTDPFQFFLGLTYSPIVEEIGFRLLPIGFYIVAYLTITMKDCDSSKNTKKLTLLKSFLYPETAKKELTFSNNHAPILLRNFVLGEWFMITFTSIIFGLAHYPLGNWGPGKLLSATFSGFSLGIVYIVYGIQASILLHWYFNYYFNAFEIAKNFLPMASTTLTFFWILNLILGIFGLFILTYTGLSKMFKRH